MRTTVTLDSDVAIEIERIRKAEGQRFKQVLNDTLRLGIRQRLGERNPSPRPSPTHPHDLGQPRVDITNFERAIAWAEGENHK
jgi:hypothetical protein